MTSEQKREAAKTVLVIAFGVLMLLSAFGPLAQYREWVLMVAGIVSIIASAVFGINLQSPTTQARNIQASRSEAQRMARFLDTGKHG